ncbi:MULTISPECIES: hypothetical protein [unclassified Bosea (in: a-proteobacteria)]|uniref:hypothetical protein n=1 Tax=unclassified Bosea (in: a-proteobacteria) TaxID=2653178 RepID=UPI000F7E7215|nr:MULTISPECIES: hypothetical protein [unclassified Bosea (in: a-proteobacteria)]
MPRKTGADIVAAMTAAGPSLSLDALTDALYRELQPSQQGTWISASRSHKWSLALTNDEAAPRLVSRQKIVADLSLESL